ncbi:Rieske (2Fe-2S) protein [Streptomyces sp. Je 1-79]|uniref:Rieske (2Fe-2S) protein n=1 Tax=Streptomyces sp. Je 1-79 TaxID=2943847 RepID=UPI0021A82886|nr:Rieske (2Fe-2S) protein [Streptomyces sp. Je 1-79]MCT4357305.1 Rieske (2Fe-2S) protein [Streptomyces sp. Je 1-79]
MTPETTPRRTVLLAGAGSVAALTAGCGSDGDSDGGTTTTPAATDTGTDTDTTSEPEASEASEPGGEELTETADIPVGGGTIFKEEKIVVTQPTAGDFKAFSAICTHQGCIVAKVENGTIDCACHGSKFRITDGSVVNGPATRPLPAEQITVSGESITLA